MEDDAELNFESPKIKEASVGAKRPSYQDIFEYCNEHMKDEVCIVSNADIIFDDTFGYFKSVNMDKQFYALSRWEISTGDGGNWEIEPFDNAASQDVWIFKNSVLTSNNMGTYTMGKPWM